jgi:serine/threonine-protein kinase
MEQPGQHAVLAGKYRLIRQLGRGGMGSVWYAEHLSLESPVAIKLIDPEISSNPEALTRFLREAKAAAALRSPHVVQILDHGVDNNTPYIAMEVLEGESLAERLARVRRLSPAETARIVTHMGRALGRAHDAGIVHRDLKPENVFLVRNDEEEIAKVLDFGIAKSTSVLAASASGSTRTGALLGTPYYMSPEQAEGLRSLDHRTDIWSMGVIAFECLVGRRPFDTETIGSLLLAICTRPMPVPSQWGSVPAGFDAWFARACARDMAQRFSSAKEAAAELRRVSEGGEGARSSATSGAIEARPSAQAATPRISAQSVVGFATTNGKNADTMRRRSGPTWGIVLTTVGLVAVGSGAFVWIRSSSSSASTVSTGAQTLVASIPVRAPEPPRADPILPAPASDPFPPASTSPSATAPRPVSITALPKAPAANAPAPNAPRAAPTAARTNSPTVAPQQPKVNLGF